MMNDTTYHFDFGFGSVPIDTSLSLINFGFQDRDEKHRQGPLTKAEHVLQYISKGKGTLCVKPRTYSVQAGDLFYLPKNLLLSYHSDASDPYVYYWVGFDGASAVKFVERMGLMPDNPVKPLCDDRITEAYARIGAALEKNNFASYTEGMGEFYKLFALLLSFEEENAKSVQTVSMRCVNQAILYIRNNFSSDINVTAIADAVGLGRNWFSTIFRKYTGLPPVQYLMRYRIDQAQKMLRQGMSVTETAIGCGFDSPANFSVQFKKLTGVSPVSYKNYK